MKIYKEKCKEKDKDTIDFALKLIQDDLNSEAVKLVAVNPVDGKRLAGSNILTVYPDGEIKLYQGMNERLGLGSKLKVIS